METILMLEFYIWHGVLMTAVVGGSFVAGFYTAKRRLDAK
tara:strand:+ start:54 stop:173 length:120 start_codon:yes stop_codon:yes gene_type:complete